VAAPLGDSAAAGTPQMAGQANLASGGAQGISCSTEPIDGASVCISSLTVSWWRRKSRHQARGSHERLQLRSVDQRLHSLKE